MDPQWEIPKLDIEKATYTVAELTEWNDAGRLVLSPAFQRGQVWQTPAKAFLIDTILRGFPIPPIHIRFVNRDNVYMREIIDGQQRLTSVLDYLSDKFALPRGQTSSHGGRPPWAGLRYSSLDPELKERILNYSFRCEVYKGQMSDSLIREIFSRINIHSVPLNDQEIRNGRFFGEFKQCAYALSREYAPFWEAAGLFSSRQAARMLDAQLVSEMLVVHLGGIQDQKKVLDRYYREYDESWPEREMHEDRFRDVMDQIRRTIGDSIRQTKFNRTTLFYTLYSAVYHRTYEMPDPRDGRLPRSPKRPLDKESTLRLRDAILGLSQYMEERDQHPWADRTAVRVFADASARHTDNVGQRSARLSALWSLAELSD